jgi:hypothetical protein
MKQEGVRCKHPRCSVVLGTSNKTGYCMKHYYTPRSSIRSHDKRKRGKLVSRKCLKCGRPFMAEGKFNRVCDLCHVTNKNVNDFHFVVGRRTGTGV